MTSLEKDNYFILLAEQDSPFILIDKETNTTILKHPTQIYKKITDEDILNKITVITQTYGGSLITLFNHKNVWFAIKDNKFISIPGEFVQFMDEFDTNNYYLFLLNDNELINYYQKTILLSIKQKYNFSDVKYENYLSKIYYHQKIHFSCTDELSMFLESMSNKNYMTKKLTIEGVLIRLTDDIYVIMQTACYKQITLLKPQTNNIHVGFLEMYQRDKLSSFLPFYSNYSNDILHRINMSMKTLSKEILNIYHLTRNKKNMQLYELLPDIYKKAIYDIHGLYISYKKKNRCYEMVSDVRNFGKIDDNNFITDECSSINVHNVYYYLKDMSIDQLIELFNQRQHLIDNALFDNLMEKTCIYIKTQTMLMIN